VNPEFKIRSMLDIDKTEVPKKKPLYCKVCRVTKDTSEFFTGRHIVYTCRDCSNEVARERARKKREAERDLPKTRPCTRCRISKPLTEYRQPRATKCLTCDILHNKDVSRHYYENRDNILTNLNREEIDYYFTGVRFF